MTQDYKRYDSPKAIETDQDLSTEKKIELLKIWMADEEALLRATSEGLNGGRKPKLKDVQAALSNLTGDDAHSRLETSLQAADLVPLKNQVDGIFGTKSV